MLFAERRAIPGWRQALSEEVKVNIERFQIMTIWLAVGHIRAGRTPGRLSV